LEHLRLEGWYPPLSAPAALVAAWQTPTSIGLQWIGVDGADSYSLERQQESGPWLTIAAVATPVSAFTDTNVATNSTYSYRLSAINAGGQSPYSQVAICAPWTPKQAWIYSNYGSADTLSSDEFLNPGPDGIAPLFRYAFNLSAHEPGHVLQPGLSTGGTPAIWLDPIRHRLQVEFVRRKAATNPAIQYQVQFTSSASDWSSPGVELTATQIDATWERVRCEDNTTTAQATARFCRVGIRSD
jgi:hypothetical protein